MATSCESERSSAYSEDLRWRIIYQVKALSKGCREVALSLNIDTSTVRRISELFDHTGDVSPKPHPSTNPGTARLTEIDKFLILEVSVNKPGIYLREIQQYLHAQTGTEVDVSTICRFLHASGFTRQKLVITAKQRSELLRAQYQIDMQVYSGHPELLVFIDETGADNRDCMRRFGYSLCGKPARAQKLLWRGNRVSAIVAMSQTGVLDCHVTTGTVDADVFDHFVRDSLSTVVQAFDGVNPNSVIVLDNASIHHVDKVVQSLKNTGVMVHFLPPYCPDLNPVEEAFSKVKSILKSNEGAMDYLDTKTAVLTAINSITEHDCKQWIMHAGY